MARETYRRVACAVSCPLNSFDVRSIAKGRIKIKVRSCGTFKRDEISREPGQEMRYVLSAGNAHAASRERLKKIYIYPPNRNTYYSRLSNQINAANQVLMLSL